MAEAVTRLLALLVAFNASPVAAQQCHQRSEVVATLERDEYQERMQGRGLHHTGRFIFELWVGPKGTWTIIRTQLDGTACIVGYGSGWSEVLAEPKGERG